MVSIDRDDSDADPQLDTLLAVEIFGQKRLLELALQQALRERRPVVWPNGLGSDQHHFALVPLLPQRGGNRSTPVAGSDDDDPSRLVQALVI
jgi:hypothetical protein